MTSWQAITTGRLFFIRNTLLLNGRRRKHTGRHSIVGYIGYTAAYIEFSAEGLCLGRTGYRYCGNPIWPSIGKVSSGCCSGI